MGRIPDADLDGRAVRIVDAEMLEPDGGVGPAGGDRDEYGENGCNRIAHGNLSASWRPTIQQTPQACASNGSPTGEWVRRRANRHYNGLMSDTRRNDFVRDWAVDLAIASVCAIFFGLIGPFGSYLNGPAWQRVAFQLACFLPGSLLFVSLIRVVLRFRLKPAMTWMSIVLGVVILNAPFQIWVVWIAVSIWPFLKFLRPLDWYGQGLITALPIVCGFTLLMQARLHRRQQAREACEAPPTAFGLLGAPPSAVLCLQMEDHYVRVHTAGNSRLVLATLNQAMTALGNTRWPAGASFVVGREKGGRTGRYRGPQSATATRQRNHGPRRPLSRRHGAGGGLVGERQHDGGPWRRNRTIVDMTELRTVARSNSFRGNGRRTLRSNAPFHTRQMGSA